MHAVNRNMNAAALLPGGVWVLRGGKSRSDAANADAIRAAFREEQGGVSMAPFNLAQRLPNTEGADMAQRLNAQRLNAQRLPNKEGADMNAQRLNAQRLPPLGAARGGSLDSASTAPLGERGVRARDLLELLASTDVLVGTLTLNLTLDLTLALTLALTLTLTLTLSRCSSACSVPGCGMGSFCGRAPCW